MDALLAVNPGDFRITASTDDYRNLTQEVVAVQGVEAASPLLEIGSFEVGVWGLPEWGITGLVAIDPVGPPAFVANSRLRGSLPQAGGDVLISEDLALQIQVGIGDMIYVGGSALNETSGSLEPRSVNLTARGIFLPPAIGLPLDLPIGPQPGNLLLVHIDEGASLREQLGVDGPATVYVEAWIERGLADPYALDASLRSLGRLERELQQVAATYSGSVVNNISSTLTRFSAALGEQRIVFLFLSIPLILLGFYLGAVGVDLGHAERRRELAVIRTRGASRGQVLTSLALEAVLGGVVASILGLVLGLVLSLLLLGIVSPSVGTVRYEDVVLSVNTIAITVVLSVLLMFIVSYRSAKRTAGLPIVETLRYHSPGETLVEYRPTVDVVLILLGVGLYGGVLYMARNSGDIVTFLAGPIVFVLVPFIPILLIIGSTRLATRGSGRLYTWAARASKPLARSLYHIVSRNLSRNPRRSSNVAVIIALGLAFGAFNLSLFASFDSWQDRQVRASIGADLVAQPPSDVDGFAQNLSRTPGVATITRVTRVQADVFLVSGQVVSSVRVFAIDPATYFEATRPESWYFVNADRAAAEETLATAGRVLVSERLASEAFLGSTDRIIFKGQSYNVLLQTCERREMTATVGGEVRALPGVPPQDSTSLGAFELPRTIYGSVETFDRLTNVVPCTPLIQPPGPLEQGDVFFLVDLASDAPWRSVKAAVIGLGGTNVRAYEEERESFKANPLQTAFLGFIRIETAFAVVALTAGLGLILFAATMERDVEFAAMTARGASARQIAVILLGEALAIMLIGLGMGLGIGLVAAFLAVQVFLTPAPGSPAPLVPVSFVVPPETLLLVGLAILAMVLTSLLLSWRLARMDVARVLKERGG